MSRRVGRVLAATLGVGLALALGSAALAAPVGTLKQFKVPTANSQPRAITNGSDGNRWFTEGTEFTSAPAKIARITSAGVITRCRCPTPVRWFTQPGDVNAPGTSNIGRIDAATGAVTTTPTTDGSTTVAPRSITVAADGQVWFTARFTPQAVGRLNPSTGVVIIFLTPSNPGPSGIAASPDGTVWFTQETRGNAASITNAGVITEGKAVKGSGPFGIAVAPNGDPWYTMMAANKIATLQLR
jgi:streptogramin lyase